MGTYLLIHKLCIWLLCQVGSVGDVEALVGVFYFNFAGFTLLIVLLLSSIFGFVLLFFLDLLQYFSSVDLDLFENISLVRFSLYLNGSVDHIAELSVAVFELSVSFHHGFVPGSI